MSNDRKAHRWLVSFVRSWDHQELDEVEVQAPRLWDVQRAVSDLCPGAVVKGVLWILPEEGGSSTEPKRREE